MTSSTALLLECDFVFYDWNHSGSRYTCNAKNLEVHEPNFRFLSMTGVHLFNKSNSDVRGIIFERLSMTYMVQGSNAFFSRVVDYAVVRSNLSYARRDDLRHMKKLKTISLRYNRISRIPQNTFVDVIELEFLSLSFNEIQSLSSYLFQPLKQLKGLFLENNKIKEISYVLFKNNRNLEELWLENNQIEFVSSNMTSPLNQLKRLKLKNNLCIDQDYNNFTASGTDKLESDLKESCSSECEAVLNEVAECNEKLYNLERENESLKKEAIRLRNYLRSSLIV